MARPRQKPGEADFDGWYGLTVTTPTIPGFGVQLAGHVEDGADSITDPMIGAGKSA